jgi:hypothetical protein
VTTAKLANGTVTSAKLVDEAVTTAKLADGAVTATKLADGAVGAAHIEAGAVTSEHLSNDSIDGLHVKQESLSGYHLLPGTISLLHLDYQLQAQLQAAATLLQEVQEAVLSQIPLPVINEFFANVNAGGSVQWEDAEDSQFEAAVEAAESEIEAVTGGEAAQPELEAAAVTEAVQPELEIASVTETVQTEIEIEAAIQSEVAAVIGIEEAPQPEIEDWHTAENQVEAETEPAAAIAAEAAVLQTQPSVPVQPSKPAITQQFGLTPFQLKLEDESVLVTVIFDQPFANSDFVLVATTNKEASYAVIEEKDSIGAVLRIVRSKYSPEFEGIVNWIAIGALA